MKSSERKLLLKILRSDKKMRNNSTYLMFERLTIIRNLIQSGCFPTLEQIQEDVKKRLGLDVSKPTLTRDLEFLRRRADCPVLYSREERGYFIAS